MPGPAERGSNVVPLLSLNRARQPHSNAGTTLLPGSAGLVLTALAAGPQHSYGIMTDVARISGDRVKLRAGTLYAALDRLRADGIIDVDREEVEPADGGTIRPRATRSGRLPRATARACSCL